MVADKNCKTCRYIDREVAALQADIREIATYIAEEPMAYWDDSFKRLARKMADLDTAEQLWNEHYRAHS